MDASLEILCETVRAYGGYPSGRKKICCENDGTVFFPAGAGMFEPNTPLAEKKVLIVIDRFTPALCFNRPKGLTGEREVITRAWERILYFLIVAGIDPLDCFFTCAVPGVPVETGQRPATPRLLQRYFRSHCHDLYRTTLRLQRPQLMIVFGLETAGFLSSLSPALHSWQHPATFTEIDRKENAIVRNICIDNQPPFHAVLLTHPSGRGYRVEQRRYRHFRGFRAEVEMARRAR